MYATIPRDLLKNAGAPDRDPDEMRVVTSGIPSIAKWVDGFEYFFHTIWHDPVIAGVDLKPGRDGKFSVDSSE